MTTDVKEQRRYEGRCVDCGVQLNLTTASRFARCPQCRKRRKENRAQKAETNICPGCGAAVGKGQVYCRECVEKQEKEMRELLERKEALQRRIRERREDEAKQAAELEILRVSAEECRVCYWARVYDGIIYCPSVEGTCLRKE